MSFFLKRGRGAAGVKSRGGATHKPGRGGSKGPGRGRGGRRPQLEGKENEELSDITSDEEILSEEAGTDQSSDSELENETPQEKRLRLTKQYLSEVEAEIDDAADSDESAGELMTKRLDQDSKRLKGRHFDSVVDDLVAPDEEEHVTILRGHQLSLTCLVISPDDKFIYTGSKDCSIIKWSFATKKKVHVLHGGRKGTDKKHTGHTSHILCMAISSSNKFLASGDLNNQIMVWDPDSMNHLHTFTHKGAVTGLAFRRESNELFSCSADRSVKLWTLDEMAYIETVYGHTDGVTAIDAMMKERAITVGGRDSTIRVWKIEDESQFVFNCPGNSLDCVSLLDEDRFLTGSDTNQICVWNISKKRPQYTLRNAHESSDNGEVWINSVRALRNTDLAASGSRDGKIKFWHVSKQRAEPKELFCVTMPGFVNDLQFASEGKFLAAAVGQEHKLGRWWSFKEARNCLAIVSLPRKPLRQLDD